MTRARVRPVVLFARHGLRLPLLFLWVLVGIPIAIRAACVTGSPARRVRLRARLTRLWMRGLLLVLGVRVRACGAESLPRPALLAANHLSWLDILVLSACTGSTFVSKAEVARWPLLGWFAQVGGTVFVRRGDGESALEVRRAMADHLRQGARLVFFPEGTTGDGHAIRRFRPRLFASALEAGVPVCPVVLHYRERTGVGCSPEVAFVGEETIVANLLRLLARPGFDAEVVVGPALGTGLGGEPRTLAHEAEAFVRQTYETLASRTAPLPAAREAEAETPAIGLGELHRS